MVLLRGVSDARFGKSNCAPDGLFLIASAPGGVKDAGVFNGRRFFLGLLGPVE
jgi:hypothetical protein